MGVGSVWRLRGLGADDARAVVVFVLCVFFLCPYSVPNSLIC